MNTQNQNPKTFAELLRHAVKNRDHAAGITARFYSLAKTIGSAHFLEQVGLVESAFKSAGGGSLPQVWRNAKSICKTGYELETAEGKTLIDVSQSFNDLKELIKAKRSAEKAAAMEKAAESMEAVEALPETVSEFFKSVTASKYLALALDSALDSIREQLAIIALELEQEETQAKQEQESISKAA